MKCILTRALERDGGVVSCVAGLPARQGLTECLQVWVTLGCDVFATFAGVRFASPHEGLPDEVRPRLKAPEGCEPLRGTASRKVGFHDGQRSDGEPWAFALNPGWQIRMQEAGAFF